MTMISFKNAHISHWIWAFLFQRFLTKFCIRCCKQKSGFITNPLSCIYDFLSFLYNLFSSFLIWSRRWCKWVFLSKVFFFLFFKLLLFFLIHNRTNIWCCFSSCSLWKPCRTCCLYSCFLNLHCSLSLSLSLSWETSKSFKWNFCFWSHYNLT